MKLKLEDIVEMKERSPLDLFQQGIRAEKTREKYTRTIRKIVCDIMEKILKGDFEERVAELVKRGKEQPEWTLGALLNLSEKLRARTKHPKDHKDYLNPASIPNYFKPLKKLFDMNDVAISWKRIYATYPELDNVTETRGWTREEIAEMLHHTHDLMDRALVLVLSSSGVRAGGLNLAWGDMKPIYNVDGRLVLDPGSGKHDIVCAELHVYKGSSESYKTFITPEAYHAVQEYGRKAWKEWRTREAKPSDPIFLRSKGTPVQASEKLLEKRIRRMVKKAKLYDDSGKPERRREVPLMNGFRRFFNKVSKETLSNDSPLAALIKKEYMMGHQGMTSLDQNYFKTNVLELAAEYVGMVPDLTIDDALRLKHSTELMSANIQELQSEKDTTVAELKKKVAELEQQNQEIKAEKNAVSSADSKLVADLARRLHAQDETIKNMKAEYDEEMGKMSKLAAKLMELVKAEGSLLGIYGEINERDDEQDDQTDKSDGG